MALLSLLAMALFPPNWPTKWSWPLEDSVLEGSGPPQVVNELVHVFVRYH